MWPRQRPQHPRLSRAMLAGDQYVACGGIDSLGSLGLGDALLALSRYPWCGAGVSGAYRPSRRGGVRETSNAIYSP